MMSRSKPIYERSMRNSQARGTTPANPAGASGTFYQAWSATP
jgi:hypothetical protein